MQASSGSPWPLIRSPVITARCGRRSERGVDHAGELALAEKRAEVNIAELQDAQAVQIVRQAGDRDIDFADVEIGALHERAVAHRDERRGQQRVAGSVEHPAAAGVHVGMHAACARTRARSRSPARSVAAMK